MLVSWYAVQGGSNYWRCGCIFKYVRSNDSFLLVLSFDAVDCALQGRWILDSDHSNQNYSAAVCYAEEGGYSNFWDWGTILQKRKLLSMPFSLFAFIILQKAILTLASNNRILKDHSSENNWVLFPDTVYFALTLESMDEIMKCYHSNECFSEQLFTDLSW